MKHLAHDHRESMGPNHSTRDWLIEGQDGLRSFRVPEQTGAANLAKLGSHWRITLEDTHLDPGAL